MPKVCQIAFRNAGISIQACRGKWRGASAISFLLETFTSPKKPFLFFLFVFWLFESLPWIKKMNQSPPRTFFLSGMGTDRDVFAEDWHNHVYFLGVKSEESHEHANSLSSLLSPVSSSSCGWSLSSALSRTGSLWLSLCFTSLSASPVSRLSSPQTFFWPLRTLVPFGALVNAILHPLTWLVRTSFSGFNSDTPPSGDLTWFPGPEVETAPGLPRAFCKDTLPLHLVARWRVLLDLLLPFPLLPSFPFAPSSPSPSPPSLECPLFVQYPDSTGKERSPLAPHTGCLSLASLDPIPAALLGAWEAGQGTCIHGLPAFRSPSALALQGHQVRSEGGREGTWGSSPPPPLLPRPSNKGCGPPQCPSLLSHLAGFWFCLSFFCLQAFLGLLTVPPSLFQGYSSELGYFP